MGRLGIIGPIIGCCILLIGCFFFSEIGKQFSLNGDETMALVFSIAWISIFLLFFDVLIISPLLQIPSVISGRIERYSEAFKFNNVGIAKQVTFLSNNGKRVFFPRILFKKHFWSSVNPLNTDGIFFVNRHLLFKKKITVWGFKFENRDFVFMKDLGKPNKFLYLFFVSIIFYLTYLFIENNIELILKILFMSSACLLSLICYYIRKQSLFKRRLQLLDQYDVPRPLG